MSNIDYVKFEQIKPAEFLPLLNKSSTREHLIRHEQFDLESVKAWMQSKIEVNACEGCRARAITVDKQLAGWCGIQRGDEECEDEQCEVGCYEIAVVIDDRYWGLGKFIFRDVMTWAKELGHSTILIHFLHTRPEYKFLRAMSKRVYESELMGSKFTTYELEVK